MRGWRDTWCKLQRTGDTVYIRWPGLFLNIYDFDNFRRGRESKFRRSNYKIEWTRVLSYKYVIRIESKPMENICMVQLMDKNSITLKGERFIHLGDN